MPSGKNQDGKTVVVLTSPTGSPERPGGVIRSIAREEQPEGSAVAALNVLPYDLTGRKRISQRYGIAEFADISAQPHNSTGQPVQGMIPVGFVLTPGSKIGPLPAITITSTSTGTLSTSGGSVFFPNNGSVTWSISPNQDQLQASIGLKYIPYATDYISPYPTLQVSIQFGNIITLDIVSQASTDGTYDYVWLMAGATQLTPPSVQYGGGPANGAALSVSINASTSWNGQHYSGTVTANSYTESVSGAELSPSVTPVVATVAGSGAGSLSNPISTSSIVEIS